MTVTARSGPGPGSRRSSVCWTCRPGRPGRASSSGRNARTRARRCGPPTLTGTGSPASPPTPRRPARRSRTPAPAPGRCEDRIRCAKDTDLRNLPLHGYAQNQIWCEIVALACELLAWTQMPASRTRPPLGTQTAAPADLRRRRAHRPRRPPPAAPPRRPLALGQRDHHRDHPPAGPRPRLTSQNRPDNQEGTRGPVEPRPPGATAGQAR